MTLLAASRQAVEGFERMICETEIREAEVEVTMPPPTNAGLLFIGCIHCLYAITLRPQASLNNSPDPSEGGGGSGISGWFCV
jgi:hypothetical protein